MKKIIFTLLAISFFLIAVGQKNFWPKQFNSITTQSNTHFTNSKTNQQVNAIGFKPRKQVTSDWDSFGNQWFYSDSIRNSYNISGNITKKLWYLGSSTDPEKNTYTYNGNGKLIADTGLTWTGSSYLLNTLDTYVYDANGNKTQETHYSGWNGTFWFNGSKRDYTYDVNNNQTQSLTQDWIGTTWNNSYKDDFTWSTGVATQQISQSWNGATWDNNYKADFTNTSGQLSSLLYYSWNGTTWVATSKLNNIVWYQWFGFFDESSKLSGYIEQVPNGSLWKDTLKLSLTYDSFGNQTDYLYQSKPGAAYITSNEFKNLYQYDSNNNIIEDIQQNWNASIQAVENWKKKQYSDFYQYSNNSCAPNQPGPISGNTSVGAGSNQTYSVAPVATATGYVWTLPSGYSGSSTSNSISVTIGNANGVINVVAQNSCGVSPATSMQLTVPGSTTIAQVNLCQPYKFKSTDLSQFCNINGMMLTIAQYDGLWKSDGTPAGTIKINASPQYITGPLVTLGNTAYFKSGMQIWKTDGTEAGTVMVLEIPNTASLGSLVPAGNFVFFQVANNNSVINKLWKTDGTAAGTSMVMDIDPTNSISWDPRYLFAYNNNIYFKAGNSTYGMELWKSDGTAVGTAVVRDVNPGSGDGVSSLGSYFAIYNNELYYRGGYATSGTFSYGLWKTNGTDPGTMLVKATSYMDNLIEINGLLYFFAYDEGGNVGNSLYGEELWRSDGTPSGTYMIKDIKPGSGSGISSGSQLANINGKIVFGASDGTTGIELWASDGTAAGTQLLKDINSGTSGSLGNYFTASDAINGYIYFGADNGTLGRELWVTDGSSSGTFLVTDIWTGTNGSGPWGFHIFNGNLYFNAEQSSFNGELWSCGNFVGIPTIENDKAVEIYPNPCTGIFNLKTTTDSKHNGIKVFNTQGQIIYESSQMLSTIDLSNQSKGIYFIQIKSDNKIVNKKVIVQ